MTRDYCSCRGPDPVGDKYTHIYIYLSRPKFRRRISKTVKPYSIDCHAYVKNAFIDMFKRKTNSWLLGILLLLTMLCPVPTTAGLRSHTAVDFICGSDERARDLSTRPWTSRGGRRASERTKGRTDGRPHKRRTNERAAEPPTWTPGLARAAKSYTAQSVADSNYVNSTKTVYAKNRIHQKIVYTKKSYTPRTRIHQKLVYTKKSYTTNN